eukprot:138685_1
MSLEQVDNFPKLPKELTMEWQEMNQLQHTSEVDLIQEQNYFSEITDVKCINDFRQLLISKNESKEEIYFQLLNPSNWQMLINGIYEPDGAIEERIQRLQTLLNITEKAPQQERYRVIELTKPQTKKKLIDVQGAMEFLRGLGFEYTNSSNKPALRLFQVNSAILNVALRCLNYKIKLVRSLDGLQMVWQKTIQIMYEHPSFEKQYNILDSFIIMNFNANSESYDKLLNKIKKAQNKIPDPNQLPVIEIINEFGLKLDMTANKQLTTDLLLNLKTIYKNVNIIEKHKNDYRLINERSAAKRELISMYSELNRLWFKTIELMKTDEIFIQQFHVLEKLIDLDFTKQNDYDFILRKAIETGQKSAYSKEILAAQKFISSLDFVLLNDQFKNAKGKNILKLMMKVLHKIEEIESYTQKSKRIDQFENQPSVHLFRVHIPDKYDKEFINNEDNVVGNDNVKVTAGFKIRHAPKMDDIVVRRRGAVASPKIQRKRRAEHIVSGDEMDSPLLTRSPPPITLNNMNNIDDNLLILNNSDNYGCNETIINCKYSNGVIQALKFYQTINLNNISHQNKLVHYFHCDYKTLLDDQIHIKLYHDFELNLLATNREILCEMNEKCLSIQRLNGTHFFDEKIDEEFMFYRDTMDSIHCYVCHLEFEEFEQTAGNAHTTKGLDIKYDDDEPTCSLIKNTSNVSAVSSGSTKSNNSETKSKKRVTFSGNNKGTDSPSHKGIDSPIILKPIITNTNTNTNINIKQLNMKKKDDSFARNRLNRMNKYKFH